MQKKVYQTHSEYPRVKTSASSGVGRAGPHRHIAAAIKQWQRRLNACDACEKAEWPGGYF